MQNHAQRGGHTSLLPDETAEQLHVPQSYSRQPGTPVEIVEGSVIIRRQPVPSLTAAVFRFQLSRDLWLSQIALRHHGTAMLFSLGPKVILLPQRTTTKR